MKKATALLLALFMVLSLTACGEAADDTTATTTTTVDTTTAEVTTTVQEEITTTKQETTTVDTKNTTTKKPTTTVTKATTTTKKPTTTTTVKVTTTTTKVTTTTQKTATTTTMVKKDYTKDETVALLKAAITKTMAAKSYKLVGTATAQYTAEGVSRTSKELFEMTLKKNADGSTVFYEKESSIYGDSTQAEETYGNGKKVYHHNTDHSNAYAEYEFDKNFAYEDLDDCYGLSSGVSTIAAMLSGAGDHLKDYTVKTTVLADGTVTISLPNKTEAMVYYSTLFGIEGEVGSEVVDAMQAFTVELKVDKSGYFVGLGYTATQANQTQDTSFVWSEVDRVTTIAQPSFVSEINRMKTSADWERDTSLTYYDNTNGSQAGYALSADDDKVLYGVLCYIGSKDDDTKPVSLYTIKKQIDGIPVREVSSIDTNRNTIVVENLIVPAECDWNVVAGDERYQNTTLFFEGTSAEYFGDDPFDIYIKGFLERFKGVHFKGEWQLVNGMPVAK